MKYRIVASGIYGADGEYPVGHEFETDADMPAGWAGKVIVVESAPAPEAVAVTNTKGK